MKYLPILIDELEFKASSIDYTDLVECANCSGSIHFSAFLNENDISKISEFLSNTKPVKVNFFNKSAIAYVNFFNFCCTCERNSTYFQIEVSLRIIKENKLKSIFK